MGGKGRGCSDSTAVNGINKMLLYRILILMAFSQEEIQLLGACGCDHVCES